MIRPPAPFTDASRHSATQRSQARIEAFLADAERVRTDSQRDARLAAQKCRWCFYMPRVGGAAMTTQPCAACGVSVTYGSTATDVVCAACAKQHDACRTCGGALDGATT